MSNLIKTGDGKLIKYTADASYITCQGFTTTNPLPTGSNLTLSEISITSQYYGQNVSITNGDEACTYMINTNGTVSSSGSVSSVTDDAIYISGGSSLSSSYAGKYYLRSTKTWSTTRPTIDKLIKIN